MLNDFGLSDCKTSKTPIESGIVLLSNDHHVLDEKNLVHLQLI